jgi:hypothetical protein
MKKKELIERIAEEAGVPKSEAQKRSRLARRSRSQASGSSPLGSVRPGRAGTRRLVRR